MHNRDYSCHRHRLTRTIHASSHQQASVLIMLNKQICLFIVVVTAWVVYMSETEVTFKRYRPFDDVIKVSGSPYQEVSADSVRHCGTLCASHSCSSFFFLPTSGKCLLNEMVLATPDGGQSSPGARYFKAESVDCPSRDGYVWLQGSRTCIKFYQTPMIFMDSYRTCTSVGTRLAVLNTTAKYKAVTTYLTANGISVGRISIGGARDGAINGSRTTWNSSLHALYWVNGMKMALSGPDTFWLSGNPDNYFQHEGCLEIQFGQWNDGPCDSPKPFICEKVLN